MFGQSDRLLLDSAIKEANTTQVLSMMNGAVEKLVVANRDAHIYELSEGSVKDRIRALFYGILSRAPSESEMQLMETEVEEREKKRLPQHCLSFNQFSGIYFCPITHIYC